MMHRGYAAQAGRMKNSSGLPMHDADPRPPDRSWPDKFRDAFTGLALGLRGQSSFYVHIFATVLVLAAGFLLHLNHLEWAVLAVCVTIVFTAEMFNTALEQLARAVRDEHHPHLGAALDLGSAAVLLAALGAAVVGAIVFLNRLGPMVGWW